MDKTMFASTYAKFVLVIVALAIIAGGYMFINNYVKNHETLVANSAKQEVVIASATDTIEKTTASNKVTEDINVAVVSEAIVITAKQDKYISKAKIKIVAIEKEITKQDPNNSDKVIVITEKEKNDAKSAVLIDSLWEAYCSGIDNQTTECKKSA